MDSSMREFHYQGAHWRVREVDASRIPGARGPRCLIFDSEGIVRRVWAFPDAWAVLDDDGVWNLLDGQLPSPLAVPFVERRAAPRGDHRTVVAATAAAARARSRAIERGVVDPMLRRLRKARTTELSDAFGVPIEPMRSAVHAYTTTLKRDGATPEHAVVLVKAAIQEGLGGPAGRDEPGAEDMMSDAVVWCIEAYYET